MLEEGRGVLILCFSMVQLHELLCLRLRLRGGSSMALRRPPQCHLSGPFWRFFSLFRSTKLDYGLADSSPVTECARSSQCISYKHHFDECAERVTKQHEDPNHKGPKEDCVEECECHTARSKEKLGVYLTCYSLPPPTLCNTVCCSEAVSHAQVSRFGGPDLRVSYMDT